MLNDRIPLSKPSHILDMCEGLGVLLSTLLNMQCFCTFAAYKLNIKTMTQNILWQLFLSFMKIGAFTIGGGYAMLPLIEREVVNKRSWVPQEDWLNMIVLAQTAPGILAINISILVGNQTMGKRGALVAALGSAIPSFFIILIFAISLSQFQGNVYVDKVFRTIRPAVVALIAVPVFSLAKSAKVNRMNVWCPIGVALGIWLLGVSPIYIIVGALAIGIGYTLVITSKDKTKQ